MMGDRLHAMCSKTKTNFDYVRDHFLVFRRNQETAYFCVMPKSSKKLPYYGESRCEMKKKDGDPCANNAYYRHRKSGQVLCGVHCKLPSRVKLPQNPKAEEIKAEKYKLHKLTVEVFAAENRQAKRRGKLTCQKMRMMKPVELQEGCLNVFPNNKHQNRTDGFGCASLSPMQLGPVEHNQPGLPISLTIENYHQFNKCFPNEIDKEGNPLPEFYTRRDAAYVDPVPHRHKFDLASLKKMNKDFVSGNESVANAPMFSVHLDANGKERRYSYVESRFFYCKWYERLATQTEDFKTLKEKLAQGYNLCICGYDAYQPNVVFDARGYLFCLQFHYENPLQPFGHELVLFTLLLIDDPYQYPWNMFYNKHKKLYEPLSFTMDGDTPGWGDEQEEKNQQLADTLTANGHVCVEILHSYPSQIDWCEQEPCAKK